MVDELWPGGPVISDSEGVYKVGTDAILLSHFFRVTQQKSMKRVVDLGCGCGVIAIILAYCTAGLIVDGIDIMPEAVCCATKSAELSGLSDRVSFIEADIRLHRELFKSGVYDHAIANPPYYEPHSGRQSGDTSRASARSEELCSLNDICEAACYLLRWGGSFSLVHKPERLADIFRVMSSSGLEPKRVRFVQNKISSPPNLVLIESRRGGKPSLTVEAPFILKNDDGSDSDELKQAYHI